jgi:ABC-2 type transport system permease protein
MYTVTGESVARDLRWQGRIVRRIAGTQLKLRYLDSVLGYFWSLARPLALFSILYFIFGRVLRFGGTVPHYEIFLLVGIVLFYFVADATTSAMRSIAEQGSLLRRIAFPPAIIPVAFTVTAFVTFAVNLLALFVLVFLNGVPPRPEWMLLVPLLLELYLFVLGLSLFLATLYVRLRDTSTIWELALRVGFYASAILFPLQVYPEWAQRLVVVIPFTQVLQDSRVALLGTQEIATVSSVWSTPYARLIPLAIVSLVLLGGISVFRKQAPWFAERL